MDILIVGFSADQRVYFSQEAQSINVFSQVSTADCAAQGIELFKKRPPALLICGLRMSDPDGMRLIKTATTLNVPSLVVSDAHDEKSVLEAVESGATGYLLKDSIEKFKDAFLEVLQGGSPIHPTVARYIVRRVRNKRKTRNKT